MTDFKKLSLHGLCNIYAYTAGLTQGDPPVHLVIHLNQNYNDDPDNFVVGQTIAHAVCQRADGELFDGSGLLGINRNNAKWQEKLIDYIITTYYSWDEPYCSETDPLDIVTMSASKLKEITIKNPDKYDMNPPTVLTKDEFMRYESWIHNQLEKEVQQ